MTTTGDSDDLSENEIALIIQKLNEVDQQTKTTSGDEGSQEGPRSIFDLLQSRANFREETSSSHNKAGNGTSQTHLLIKGEEIDTPKRVSILIPANHQDNNEDNKEVPPVDEGDPKDVILRLSKRELRSDIILEEALGTSKGIDQKDAKGVVDVLLSRKKTMGQKVRELSRSECGVLLLQVFLDAAALVDGKLPPLVSLWHSILF